MKERILVLEMLENGINLTFGAHIDFVVALRVQLRMATLEILPNHQCGERRGAETRPSLPGRPGRRR